ncbi:MAG: MoaD/ThiS family protein [Acidimicrobiales bacterium]
MAVLRLFGPAREAAGVARVEVAGCTVADVLRTAEARYGSAFSDIVGTSKIWINGEPAAEGTSVAEQDEVAVVPPVSGG